MKHSTKMPSINNIINNHTQDTSFNCPNCQQTHKKLKILESDYQFQLKKLAQDKSTQKALYQISIQKQLRKISEKYDIQKQNHQADNKNWIEKHDTTLQFCKQQISKIKSQSQFKMQQTQQKSQKQILSFKETKQKQFNSHLQKINDTHYQQVKTLKQNYIQTIKKIKQQNDKAIKNMKEKHQTQLSKKIKQYQSLVVGITSQKRTQQNMHQQTKKDHEAKLVRLYQQIYNQKKEIMGLQSQITQLKKNISQLKGQIINKQNENQQLKKDHLEQINYLNTNNSNLLTLQQKKFKSSVEKIYQESIQKIQKYNQQMKNIQEIRINQIKIYQENLQQIQQSVEERPSRLQDLEQITQLKSLLSKKQKEISLLMQQLKWYRLQLENKQETYNRIFVSQHNYPTNNNQNGGGTIAGKKKEFKLRRAGRSVTTVRQILNSIANGQQQQKKTLQPVNQNLKNVKIL